MKDWRNHAACKDFPLDRITDVFFSPPPGDAEYAEAKAICADCPVKFDCGEYGRHERWGVWGGRTPAERGVRPDTPAPTPTLRACARCGGEMATTRTNQKYCSARCSKAVAKQQWNARYHERKTA
jgi:hypothetical protein